MTVIVIIIIIIIQQPPVSSPRGPVAAHFSTLRAKSRSDECGCKSSAPCAARSFLGLFGSWVVRSYRPWVYLIV